MQAHKDTLIRSFASCAGGRRQNIGTWEEVFGKGKATDEVFTSWYYARYVGKVARLVKPNTRYRCT